MKRAITSSPSLASVCELVVDTHDCKIMTVKRGSEIALASMGYFTGLETQFRVCFCGSRAALTVWRSDGKISQWDWTRSEDSAIPDARDSKLTEGAKAMIGKVWFAMRSLIEEDEA
jgi:hypothetical protein